MSTQSKIQKIKEVTFYLLGVLLIGGFVILYFPQFFGINRQPPVIGYLLSLRFPSFLEAIILPAAVHDFLLSNWATIWTITVNAMIFLVFLVFLSYRTNVGWRSKGAFAAFILALFAEMYGIPLLLFILSPLMPLSYYANQERSWLNNPLIFGWNGAVVGDWLTLMGMILVVVGWHQIHRATGLVTSGLYKYIRHPQYTGIYMIMTGWLLHWETTPTLIMFPILVATYYFLARKEERDLRKEFGKQYEIYHQETYMFLPIELNIFKARNA